MSRSRRYMWDLIYETSCCKTWFVEKQAHLRIGLHISLRNLDQAQLMQQRVVHQRVIRQRIWQFAMLKFHPG